MLGRNAESGLRWEVAPAVSSSSSREEDEEEEGTQCEAAAWLGEEACARFTEKGEIYRKRYRLSRVVNT